MFCNLTLSFKIDYNLRCLQLRMPFFKAAVSTCRARAAVMLSRIMILSADSLCAWCRHGARSQALRVGSCQVMEVSLARTRRARVFRMQSGPSRCPDVKQSDALNRCLADVQGPAGKNQDGATGIPQTSGSVAFRCGWLQAYCFRGELMVTQEYGWESSDDTAVWGLRLFILS